MDDYEVVSIFAKGCEVTHASGAGLKPIWQGRILQPAARFRVDDAEDDRLWRSRVAVDIRGHDKIAVTGVEIHFIAAADLSDAWSDFCTMEVDNQGKVAAGNQDMIVVAKNFARAVAFVLSQVDHAGNFRIGAAWIDDGNLPEAAGSGRRQSHEETVKSGNPERLLQPSANSETLRGEVYLADDVIRRVSIYEAGKGRNGFGSVGGHHHDVVGRIITKFVSTPAGRRHTIGDSRGGGPVCRLLPSGRQSGNGATFVGLCTLSRDRLS